MILSYLVVHSRGGEFILYDHHYDPKHSHHLRSLKNALHLKLCIFRSQNIPGHSRWSFSVFQKVFSADLAGDWAWGEQCVMEAVLQVDISFGPQKLRSTNTFWWKYFPIIWPVLSSRFLPSSSLFFIPATRNQFNICADYNF